MLAITLMAASVVVLLSIFGQAGAVGGYIDSAFSSLFGILRIFLSIALFITGWNVLFPGRTLLGKAGYLGLVLFIFGATGFINLVMLTAGDETATALKSAGGYVGLITSSLIASGLGATASGVIAFALMIIGVILIFELTFDHLLSARDAMSEKLGGLRDGDGPLLGRKNTLADDLDDEEEFDDTVLVDPEDLVEAPAAAVVHKSKMEKSEVEEEPEEEGESVMTSSRRRRIQIPVDLLDERAVEPVSGDIEASQEIIRKTFSNFNIEVDISEVRVGPTVTQYALKPQSGVKLARIVSLQNDLALALAAHPIRIEAPIPGKSLVGIEVPNQTIGSVGLRELLESKEFKTRKSAFMAPLGIDVSGNVISILVDKAPHMLVAGATGSGKSVCLNTIIASLLYQNGPDDLKLIMIDPKRVEMGRYAGIPHLLTPPITKPEEALNALKWAVREMERRLDHLAKFGVRDIDAYNKKSQERMPKIVIIIDELADLMSQSQKREVEAVIVRIAQMARAAGIHLILATQRPSVDVITGLIKANIPTRLAFAVASQVDSKTILDVSGAEKLLGRGDMLVSTPQIQKPKRLQGAFVDDDEIEKIVDFLKKEGEPDYNLQVLETERNGSTVMNEGGDEDPLLDEAVQLVIESGKASTSYLQRRMRIGYSRAARLIDLMEDAGAVGPQNGSKAREIMVDKWPRELRQSSLADAVPAQRPADRTPDEPRDDDDLPDFLDGDVEELEDEEELF